MASKDRGKRLLCHCLSVTWEEVETTVREHHCRKVSEVTRICGAGGGCKTCHYEIEQVIREVRREEKRFFEKLFCGLFPSRKEK